MNAKFSAILSVLLFFSGHVVASHIVGANITYEYAGTGAVFKVKLYRDCFGIGAPTSVTICFTSPSGCAASFNSTLLLNPTTSGIEVPFNTCNGVTPTYCNGGNTYSFEEYNYEGYVSPPACSDWIISYSECCRNAAATNLLNPNVAVILVETTYDNLNYPTNSSPQFNTMPVNYHCIGAPSIIDYSAYDIDGDSLSYEFIEILEGTCGASVPLPFLAPYTFDQPLATFTPAVLDPYGGQILFTPSTLQISVVGFRVKEYRNGVLIGSVRRDDAVVVTGSYVNPDTIAGRVYYDLNYNSIFDSGDIPASNVVVELTPGTTCAVSAISGKYDFQVPAGTYTIDITNVPPYMNLVTPPYTVTTANTGTFTGNFDFALQPVAYMTDLVVTIHNSGNAVAGQTYPVYVNYENAGTTNQNNAIIVANLDPVLSFVSSSPSPSSIAGNTITWNLPPMGIFSNGIINITTTVDSNAVAGDPVYCDIQISIPANEQTPLNNSDSFTDVIAVSIDPNHKEVLPAGDLPLSFVTSQQWLNYKINFQNTGTAPAQIIRIKDLLDLDLDISTLELVASSYPCAMLLQNQNELEFNFFGINLTTALQNAASSHGYVEYRIKPKTTVPVGSLITNRASIFFDFNAPVLTTLAYNKVVLSTGIETINDTDLSMTIFPNPAHDDITVEIANKQTETATLKLNNLLGEVVFTGKIELIPGTNLITLPVNEMNPGLYFMTLNRKKSRSTVKLLVQ